MRRLIRHRLSPRETVAVVIWGTMTVPGSVPRRVSRALDAPCRGDADPCCTDWSVGAVAWGASAIARFSCSVGLVALSPGGTADMKGSCPDGVGALGPAAAPA